MQVVLSTIGKFHTFDLARQLYAREALKTVFSGYPWWKLREDGLPRETVKTFPWIHAPYMRFAPKRRGLKIYWEWWDRALFDRYVARELPECDLFCGLSGSALRTGKVAKRRGAKYVCDRGSSHIRFQDRILREEYESLGVRYCGIDPRIVEKEEAEYELSDAIFVPSGFVLNSFVELGVPRRKLYLVPYGVDLVRFRRTCFPRASEFNVLFVGSTSVRKGIAYLLRAFEMLQHGRKTLTIAGSTSSDSISLLNEYASRGDVRVLGHVAQSKLKDLMSASHVMVLPSIEEGLALVQAQAMACGCPVIATTNTGAADLFTDGREGFIVPIRDPDSIADRLQKLADNPPLRDEMSAAALRRVQKVGGWDQYGDSAYRVFGELLAGSRPD
jgi:glycosyltransferase involved in cell wall biosynthesis